MYVSVAECDMLPAVPVTVTAYVPREPLQEIVNEELLDGPSVTLVSLNEHESPGEDVDACKLTVPVKPLRLVRTILEEPDPPPLTVTVDGLDVMLKSGDRTAGTRGRKSPPWLIPP